MSSFVSMGNDFSVVVVRRGLITMEKMDRLTDEELRAGFARLQEARGAIDVRAPDILACHAAIAREVDLALEMVLPRPDRLRKLGFTHKVEVLQAASESPWCDAVAPALLAFNELRNGIAHHDRKTIAGDYRALVKAMKPLVDFTGKEDPTILALANAIMAALLAIESNV